MSGHGPAHASRLVVPMYLVQVSLGSLGIREARVGAQQETADATGSTLPDHEADPAVHRLAHPHLPRGPGTRPRRPRGVRAASGSGETFEAAVPVVRRCEVDVVLYDLRCPSGLRRPAPPGQRAHVSVVALGLEESVEWVIACAEAGIAGYVTDSTSLDELVQRIEDAAHGDFHCPPHIAASLLHRLATIGPLLGSPGAASRLTSRELEVAALLQEGLSNKQIAHRLTIQLATVKNHVHSILEKLETPTRSDAAAVLRRTEVTVPGSFGTVGALRPTSR